MIIVATNLTDVTDIPPQPLYSGRRMNPQTTAKTSSRSNAAGAWNDGRIAAVVEAAYLLDLTRR